MTSNRIAGPFLLFLDARALPLERHCELAAATDAGYRIALATPNPAGFAGSDYSALIEVDVGDYAEAERRIVAGLDRLAIRPSGILAWKDMEVELAARLNSHYGLPGSPVESVRNVRDKAETRRLIDAIAPAVNPHWAAVASPAEAASAQEHVGVPALLKPAGNSGGRGMFLIDEGTAAAEIFDRFTQYNRGHAGHMYRYYEERAVFEEKVTGSEHSLAGAVVDGRVVVFGISDKQIDPEVPIQFQNCTPSQLSGELQDQIVGLARKIVPETGVNWCGFHMDFMATADGPKILEIGGRLGGEFINSHLIPLSQPILRPYRDLIDVVQGRNPFSHEDYRSHACRRAVTHVLRPPHTGTVAHVDGLEKVARHPNVRHCLQMSGAGSEMCLPADRFKAYEIAYVILQCELDDDVATLTSEIEDMVAITMKS